MSDPAPNSVDPRERANVPWGNLVPDIIVLAIGALAMVIFAAIDVRAGCHDYFARSGAVAVLASAVVAYRSLSKHYEKIFQLPKTGRALRTSRNQSIIDRWTLVQSIVGTFVWAYGDKLFSVTCAASAPDKGWWHELKADPTAIFTALLVVATFLLWRATRDLVLDTKNTAERELRAYVSVEGASLSEDPKIGFPVVAQVTVKNFGKTPAYALTGTGGIATGASFDTLPAATPTGSGQTRSGLPPGATTDQFHKSDDIVWTSELLGALTDGSWTLWVYGEMHYRDAFGVQRFTKYRFQTGGTTDVRGNQLAICEEGNEET